MVKFLMDVVAVIIGGAILAGSYALVSADPTTKATCDLITTNPVSQTTCIVNHTLH